MDELHQNGHEYSGMSRTMDELQCSFMVREHTLAMCLCGGWGDGGRDEEEGGAWSKVIPRSSQGHIQKCSEGHSRLCLKMDVKVIQGHFKATFKKKYLSIIARS